MRVTFNSENEDFEDKRKVKRMFDMIRPENQRKSQASLTFYNDEEEVFFNVFEFVILLE